MYNSICTSGGFSAVRGGAEMSRIFFQLPLPSLAKGLAFFGISEFRRKNQKIISSNDENVFSFQSENYDVFNIDEMLIIF